MPNGYNGKILRVDLSSSDLSVEEPSAEFLITSKNQEAPAHMPQMKRSLALIFAANPYGADHMCSEHDFAYTDRNI